MDSNTSTFMQQYADRAEKLRQNRAHPPACTCTGPSVSTLKTGDVCEVLFLGRDGDAHHVLWVCWNGHVNLTALGTGQGPTFLDGKPEIKFRLETFGRGNGYVGVRATQDLEWVRKLEARIKRAWREDSVGYVDY